MKSEYDICQQFPNQVHRALNKKEGNMPRFDGTGPAGAGQMTGRGLGPCGGAAQYGVRGQGMGLGMGRRCGYGRGAGFGRGYGFMARTPVATPLKGEELKAALLEQKQLFQARMDAIDQQIESL